MSTQQQIETLLNQGLKISELEVINESHGHNVAPGSESHFKVRIVSDDFEGKNAVQRHQAVYGILSEPMANGVHALALHTYTLGEWAKEQGVPDSPPCLGGSKA